MLEAKFKYNVLKGFVFCFYFIAILYVSLLCGNEIPSWMIEQISKDLAPFQEEGIHEDSLSRLMQEGSIDYELCRFKIINNHIFVQTACSASFHARVAFLKASFRKLAQKYVVPDVDFIVCLHDATQVNRREVPLFVFAKDKSYDFQVLMPDFEALSGYQRFSFLSRPNHRCLWRKKIEKVLWRGASTGGTFSIDQWRSLPRSRLVLLSFEYPDWIDARFTSLLGEASINPEMLALPQLLGNYINPNKSIRYKYLIDVDGNTCSYSRCYWILLSNCLSIKQVTDNIQWYYGALKPYVHYVPVQEDLGDLIEKIQWVKEHDQEAHSISKCATDFVLNNLQEEHIYLYLFTLLQSYAGLQNFNPI